MASNFHTDREHKKQHMKENRKGEKKIESRKERDRKGKEDRKSTRLNSSHVKISYAVFCLKKKIRLPDFQFVTLLTHSTIFQNGVNFHTDREHKNQHMKENRKGERKKESRKERDRKGKDRKKEEN